jgi:hypothetical protein
MPEREEQEFNPSQHTGGALPRSYFSSDQEYQRYLAQVQQSQEQINRLLGDYGSGAQQRGYNTAEEYDTVRDAEHRRWLIQKGLLPTLGFIGGSAALGAVGGGGSAASAASAGSGSLPPIAGGSPWAVTPYAGSATMAGTGAGAGAAMGGAGGLGSLLGGLSARDLAALGLTAAGTIGAATQDRPQFGPNTMTADPNLQALMQSMQRRLDKSEPLYDSVLNMANGLLPTQYQRGGGGMG